VRGVSGRQLVLAVFLLASGSLASGVYAYTGWYGFNVFLLRGGSVWTSEPATSHRLSPSMRLALQDPVSPAQAGPFAWRQLSEGFDVTELPALVAEHEVDRVLLARIDPTRFRFEVRNAPAGNKQLSDWMAEPGTVLVINGSYYALDGTPDTPVLSQGIWLGPHRYDAKHGAFVASDASTGIRDLASQDWQTAFDGAHDAMVSYPLLLAADGSNRVTADQHGLANRSFIGRDREGRIVLGTTKDAFFSLGRLAAFLREAPLGLTTALNLDGGPVACQGIAFGGFSRRFCGHWEYAMHEGVPQLLTWRWGKYGRWALPIVLIVVPKGGVARS
jgi:Phosphodiester glycosidase